MDCQVMRTGLKRKTLALFWMSLSDCCNCHVHILRNFVGLRASVGLGFRDSIIFPQVITHPLISARVIGVQMKRTFILPFSLNIINNIGGHYILAMTCSPVFYFTN